MKKAIRTQRGMVVVDRPEPPPEVGEINEGPLKVERDGYIPRSAKIKMFIEAGQRLADYRRELYHYGPDEKDDGFVDPVGQYTATDLIDESLAVDALADIEERVKQAREEAVKKQREQAVEPAESEGSSEKEPE